MRKERKGGRLIFIMGSPKSCCFLLEGGISWEGGFLGGGARERAMGGELSPFRPKKGNHKRGVNLQGKKIDKVKKFRKTQLCRGV